MRCKAQRDVHSCAVGDTQWILWLNDHETCIPSEDFSIPVEKTVAMTVQSKIQQQHKKSGKLAISNPFCTIHLPSVLWLLGGLQEGHPACKNCWGAGAVICLGWSANLHMAQLMPLPLTVSCCSKSRLVLLFWYQLTRISWTKGR